MLTYKELKATYDIDRNILGKGSFGKVILVRKKDSDELFAMKVLSKPNVVLRKQVEHTRTERRVLGAASSPFVVRLHAAAHSRLLAGRGPCGQTSGGCGLLQHVLLAAAAS